MEGIHFVCESSSVGRAQPCQGWGREFESRLSLNGNGPRLKKGSNMKKVLMIALIAVAFAACTSNTTNDSAASADTTCVDSCAVDSTVAAPVDTVNAEEVK
jgi:hypothetical protein